MKTYVEVLVSSECEKASVITDKFFDMGFKTTFGQHDFVYNWKDKATLIEVLRFVDKVQSNLKGFGIILKFTTID